MLSEYLLPGHRARGPDRSGPGAGRSETPGQCEKG
ncbi:hypothetical protein ABIB27_002209 [Arthrobacter sp. UYEF21]